MGVCTPVWAARGGGQVGSDCFPPACAFSPSGGRGRSCDADVVNSGHAGGGTSRAQAERRTEKGWQAFGPESLAGAVDLASKRTKGVEIAGGAGAAGTGWGLVLERGAALAREESTSMDVGRCFLGQAHARGAATSTSSTSSRRARGSRTTPTQGTKPRHAGLYGISSVTTPPRSPRRDAVRWCPSDPVYGPGGRTLSPTSTEGCERGSERTPGSLEYELPAHAASAGSSLVRAPPRSRTRAPRVASALGVAPPSSRGGE